MGGCIYTPGQKNAYIPINHTDIEGNRLYWQLTEQDLAEEFSRLDDTKILMHNGSFDYQVIKCTCGIALPLYWDTMIAARLLDENERSAGLKDQYINKIDPTQEKYDIEGLFQGLPYAIFAPDLFAYYAATDAYMTYKLYEWQFKQFNSPGNERLFNLFKDIEMPLVIVAANMELKGICIDEAFSKRLSIKYHNELARIDEEISQNLKDLEPTIQAWRLTPEANVRPIKKGWAFNENTGFWYNTKTGKISEEDDVVGKSKSEQLDSPINLASAAQLAILFYDILKTPTINKKAPRSTDEETLETIAAKYDLNICKSILKRRTCLKLINTYIDKMPNSINPADNRLHCHFKQSGTDTGRFSSADPNLQNVPAREKSIRMMFVAAKKDATVSVNNNTFYLNIDDCLFNGDTWVNINTLNIGDSILVNSDADSQVYSKISNIIFENNKYTVTVEEV